MKINLQSIKIQDIVSGYVDNVEEGVFGMDGNLNIRPKYQREFVYKEKQRNAVIDTIRKGFPLNVIYWAVNEDGTFEVLDGQQRTISFCQFVNGDFSMEIDGNTKYFHSLTKSEQEQILNYELSVYVCDGTDKEKLDWFKIINIAGLKLEPQELRNAIYTGPWLTHAKSIFSKKNCAAANHAKGYVSGEVDRQAILEIAIDWISKGNIDEYMSVHQNDPNANALWTYFRNVIDWVKSTFPKYRKEMNGIPWGPLYDEYHDNLYDTNDLETKISKLMMDDDVTNKKGIYSYILTGEEKHLSIRAFSPAMKREAYERQKGVCSVCKKDFKLEEMEGDHITPWSAGGKTNADNCQMLCKECNRRKSNK